MDKWKKLKEYVHPTSYKRMIDCDAVGNDKKGKYHSKRLHHSKSGEKVIEGVNKSMRLIFSKE